MSSFPRAVTLGRIPSTLTIGSEPCSKNYGPVPLSLTTVSVPDVLEADNVFLLMRKEYRISRNTRAQWYLDHLNKTISVFNRNDLTDFQEEIEVVSVIPKTRPVSWNRETCHRFQYLISPSTRVTFLSRCYRLVFCLDLSPSVASVDIQSGSTFYDEMLKALRYSLTGVVQPFYVPGSQFLFYPEIYTTIIAHVPFYTSNSQQVLAQGWLVTHQNVELLLDHVCSQLRIGVQIAEATSIVNEQRARKRMETEKLTGALFEEVTETVQNVASGVAMSSPDINTVNMLRYGILALQLLPENSSTGIIVITDGMLTLPNTVILESLLTQLRNHTIASSFLHLGSSYNPSSSYGFVPYSDLMLFIANATLGAYLTTWPDVSKSNSQVMNVYHRSFLTWNFQGIFGGLESPRTKLAWQVPNGYFYSSPQQPVERHRQYEGTLCVSLPRVLSCRLREGYTVKKIIMKGDQLEITLTLSWKFNVVIEYKITSPDPVAQSIVSSGHSLSPRPPCCRYEVAVEGGYDFLHDVTCQSKKPIKSPYRVAVIEQFWNTMKNLKKTDELLSHLQSFRQNPTFHIIPDKVKSGLPLFYLASNSSSPTLSSKDSPYTQFASFWRPICILDINIWQKWMHSHRIGILLKHDEPLPKNVHLPNASGRYNVIQCRQSLTLLNELLRTYCSFILIENHSYIKFLYNEPDGAPVSFYIIRVTAKAPCMVLRLGFLGGTPGHLRNEIVAALRQRILGIQFPRRTKMFQMKMSSPVSEPAAKSTRDDAESISGTPPATIKSANTVPCCVHIKKPVEKILIKYERVPQNFLCSFDRYGGISGGVEASMLTTLGHYLFHHRWIWNAQAGSGSSLPMPSVAAILSTIVKLRLEEGFHFAHSSSGIINMVMEIDFKNTGEQHSNPGSPHKSVSVHPCVVQYIVFPPHVSTNLRDSVSEDEEFEVTESDGELQLVTECWVEPQAGISQSSKPQLQFLNNLEYQTLTRAFYQVDHVCISNLVTFHHLVLMCGNSKVPTPQQQQQPFAFDANQSGSLQVGSRLVQDAHIRLSASRSTPDLHQPMSPTANAHSSPNMTNHDTYVNNIAFPFDLLLLLPKCQQAELLFSTLVQDINLDNWDVLDDGESGPNSLLFRLLMEQLAHSNDREVHLSERDHLLFPSQVLDRPRPSRVHRVPFQLCKDDLSSSGSQKTPSNCAPGRHVTRWRCFLKGLNPTHVILTFLPATYRDLKLLMLASTSAQDSSQLLSVSSKTTRILPNHQGTGADVSDMCYLNTQDQEPVSEKPSTHSTPSAKLDSELHQTPRIFHGSLILPIYVYHCALTSITSQLVDSNGEQRSKDIFQDLTFKTEDRDYSADNVVTVLNNPLSSEGVKLPTPELDEAGPPGCPEKFYLKRVCKLLELLFSKCFIYGVYRSLQLGLQVSSQDVEAVVDGICGETVLEIDITKFLQMICAHVKDFNIRLNLERQAQYSNQSNNSSSSGNNKAANLFSLELLQKHNPCEQKELLHKSIKAQFFETVQQYFKPVPARPDYYFFCPHHLQAYSSGDDHAVPIGGHPHHHSHVHLLNHHHHLQPHRINSMSDQQDDLHSNTGTNVNTDDIEFASDAGMKETSSPLQPLSERTSLMSLRSNIASEDSSQENDDDRNDDDDDDEEDGGISVIENDSTLSPLFVHLTCTLKDRGNVENVSLKTLPTCLGEITESMKLSDLDLNLLQVTLDVLCLTLPPEVESLSLEEGEQGNRTTSYCSTSSPLPESETLKMAPDDTESLISGNSDMPCDDSTDVLKNLPNFQYQAITSCVDKIKWMLQDEISSAALTSYPLNSITLEMVTLHVKSSMGTPCCVQQEVPLHFVFGAETSLAIFMKEFQHLSLHGFHINLEGDYYYLAVDADASGVVHSSSSVTSCQLLGLADKSPGINLPGQASTSHCLHHHHQQTQLSQSGKTAGEALLSRKLLWMLSSNSPADDSSSLMSGVQESRELPQSLLAKSVLLREELKQETGTTNDEAEPEEPGWRRKGRFRIIRRPSIRQSKEKETADSPVCIDGLPLMDSSVVKPIAVSGTVQNLAVQSGFSQQKESEEQLPKDQGTLYASTSTINAPTPETLLESSLESNSKEPTRSFQLELGHDTAFNRSTPQKEISQTEGKAENRMGSPTGSLDRAGGLSELTSDMENFDTRDRADSLDLVPGPPGRGNTSPFRRLQSANESSSSTPFMFSGHVSNTEDGYDGDSSESDSEWDHLGSADTRQPRLPPFWLIMSVAEDHVSVYFHLRNRTNPDDAELKQAIDVMRNLIKAIKSICKHVNQMLLLQELHETHMCNQLLVSESSEDIWKPDDTANSTSIFGPGRFLSADEFDDSSEYPASGYLEASLKYKPGAFDCSMVWQTHFYFHPRLCSGPGRAGRSRGIQALRSVLDPISVNNRKNMFVYKEKTGSVFYLRLQETTCTGHTCMQKADEESPLTRSRSSSIHSLQQKKTPVETEEDFPYSEFRPNLSSAMSDKDQSHDSMSITSKTSSSHKTYQCIALHVHGIGEVGEGIKEELVSVLQNRLDDAVLDVLTSMLARNPMSKLTPEDVQFIQKPGRDSNLVLHFTVPVRALPYLRPLRYYLQQNFKGFLHSPNYTDGKPENHFKSYSEETLSDEDVFLYSRHQASGKSGNKGIACVVLSVVDGKGQSQNLGGTCPPVPCPKAYLEMPNAFELDDLTSTSLYNISSTNSSPGPLALIKVQLWCVGKVATEQLQDMIKQAIRQSLWDLLLEFCVLTAPISEINQSEASFSFSAPTTPVKTRRTGRVMAEQSVLRTAGSGRVSSSFLPGISSQTLESASDTVPGQKIRSPVASPTESFSFFKFGVTTGSQPYWGSTSRNTSMPSDLPSSPLSLDARLSGASLYSQADTHSLPCDTGVRGCLLSVFHTDMKAFLQFGISLGVPTVQRKEFTLRNRHQVSVVLSEFQTQLNDMTPDVLPKLFLKVNNEYVPYSPQENVSRDRPPGESKQFVAVGRNINLWRAFMGITESACYLESAFIKDQRSYQKYQPLVLSPDRDTLSLGASVASSHATTPIPVSGLASPLPANSASSVLSTSMVSSNQHSPVDLSTPHFVPRQRLLLLLISDKYMDAYLYNWTSEMANSIFCLLSNLVTWNNQRSKALDSLVAQKLGLFIHQPLQRDLGIPASVISVDSTKEKKGGSVGKTGSSPTPSSSSPSGGVPLQLEVLLSQTSPPPFMTASMGGGTRLGGPGRTVLGAPSMATSSSRRSSNVSSPSSVVTGMPSAQEFIMLMDTRPPRPLHLCQYWKMTDVPCRYGRQLKDIHGTAKRSMEELYRIWRSKEPNVPLTDKQMMWLKQVARLSHFCSTPLLFSPTWRWKLAPVRDHTLELTTIHFNPNSTASVSSGDKSTSSSEQRRSRHNSGSSIKNSDQSQSLVSSLQNRIRRVSGSAAAASTMVSSIAATSSSGSSLYQNHLQQKAFPSYLQQAPLQQQQQQGSSNSPKPRRSYQDEAWHMTICTNYIQEYIQYLQTLGFVAVQTKAKPRSSSKDGGSGRGCVGSSSSSSLGQRSSAKGLPVFFLVKILLAGMLIFEVGFCEPYVYAYLYSLEIKRMQSPSETSRSQFVTAFLDELDRIKVVMHMHSFTYDYHLRTIHSCISGRQLLFRSGYHLSSFLDDFIKYYQKSPNFARNLIGTGTLVIPNTRMLGNKLYDHVITRNQLYGMTVVRMVPIYHGTDQDTEYALVELSTHKVSYKDMNDQHKIDSFDMGLLVTQEHVEAEGHILVLKFYILLTSQRELYPKLFHFGIPRGSFRPVRTSSSSIRSQSSSRKTSTVLGPVQEASKEAEATSESESHATSSQGSSRRTSTNVPPTMCDEEVLYLGYFSNHETFMLKFLEEQMESTRCHLDDVLSRAEVDCCRDLLWNRLMPGDKMQDPLSGRETMLAVMSYVDFTSLLELVTSVPVSEIDPELTPFLTMHLSWYQSLSRVLASRYPDTHRYFESPDGSIKHLVVMDSNCLDSFMRLTLYLSHNRAELCHVFKEDLPDKVHCPEKPNFRVLGRQNLVEDFVTTCSFHLWSGLLG